MKKYYIEITPYKGDTILGKFWTEEFKPHLTSYFDTHEEAQRCADKNVPVGRFRNVRILSVMWDKRKGQPRVRD